MTTPIEDKKCCESCGERLYGILEKLKGQCIPPCHHPQKDIEGWGKEILFDFWREYKNDDAEERDRIIEKYADKIDSILKQERERVERVIDGMKIPPINDEKYYEKNGVLKSLHLRLTHDPRINAGIEMGYNQALTDLKAKLKNEI